MATVLTHAAIPLIARRGIDLPEQTRRKATILAVVCAVLPDIDWLTLIFDGGPHSVLAHRGFTHSLAFAALSAVVLGVAFFRELRGPQGWTVIGFLFFAGASHGLLDALTLGDAGVALLWPLTSRRFLFPFHLLPVAPLGAPEVFSRWGALLLANELVFILLPLWLLTSALRAARHRDDALLVPRILSLVIWLGVAIVLRVQLPGLFTPSTPRELRAAEAGSDDDPALIPSAELPDHRLVTRLPDLERRGLLNRELKPEREPWSSSFFPFWFGGAAGRWRDGAPRLVLRTLLGFHPPERAQLDRWLTRDADALDRLSPTEKLDLAQDDLGLNATRLELQRTHNGSPRFWFGLCNGVAAAALAWPEPIRAVEVVSAAGRRVRFSPTDVKALLAESYYWTSEITEVGGACHVVAFDSGAVCSMNPATLVLAITNRLGLARRSFLLDAIPSPRNQYYAVTSARVDIEGDRPRASIKIAPSFEERVRRLVDVRIALTLASTTLSLASGDRALPGSLGRFAPVGLVPVHEEFEATLALDVEDELLGGMWRGDPANGPDSIAFVSGDPLTIDGVHLKMNPGLSWPLIREIAHASIDETAAIPVLDLRRADPLLR